MLLMGLIIIALVVMIALSMVNRQTSPTPIAPETSLSSATPEPTSTPSPTPTFQVPTPTLPEPTSEPAVFEPAFVISDCRFTLPQGANVTCGVVTVPADRDQVSGSTIRLSVAIFHSMSRSPASDPVFYLHSSPGGLSTTASALQWAALNFENFVLPILEKRDLIVYDLRGSGLSLPNLDCPEAITVYRRDQRGAFSDAQRIAAYSQALSTCRDRLTRYGIDPADYTTRASAADTKDIIRALGLEQVNLYGVAYGARLAETIIRDSPEMVRSAVFDSPLPLEINNYAQAAARYNEALGFLFDRCANSPSCSSNYPELDVIFDDLAATLDQSPLPVTIEGDPGTPDYERLVDGSTFSAALVAALNASFYPTSLPKMIYDFSQGELESSLAFIEAALSLPAVGMLDLSAGMRLAVDCHEQIYAMSPDVLYESQLEYPRTQGLGLQAILGSPDALYTLCDLWGAAPFDSTVQQVPGDSVPALIFSSQVDPISPPSFARALATTIPGSYLVEVTGGGHAPSLDRQLHCPFSLALTFLDYPEQAPDQACLAQAEIIYYTTYTGEQALELFPTRISGEDMESLVPSGWSEADNGVFKRLAYYQDETRLEIRSSAEPAAEWLKTLIADFDRVGFDRTPARTNTRYANGINWSIYRAFSNDRPVDLALAETGGRTLLVLLLSQPNERDPLYRTVFLSVIDGTTP